MKIGILLPKNSLNPPNAMTIFGNYSHLGHGTGRHASLIAELGYSVQGIDQSAEMLAQAQERASNLPTSIGGRVRFGQGDLRKINLGEPFDVITGLFHVVSLR